MVAETKCSMMELATDFKFPEDIILLVFCLHQSTVIKPVKHSRQEVDVAQVTKDLNDSLKRQKDLKEQLKCSEEERIVMRERLSKLEVEKYKAYVEMCVYADALHTLRFNPTLQDCEESQKPYWWRINTLTTD